MKTFIQQKEWLELPAETRQKLILTFAIHKSEGVVVQQNKIVSDGCSQKDLMGLTLDKMIDYLGEDWKKVKNDKLYDYLFICVLEKLDEKTKETDTGGVDTTEEEPKESSRVKDSGEGNKRGPKKRICGRGGNKTINTSSGDRQPVQPEEVADESERPQTENQG